MPDLIASTRTPAEPDEGRPLTEVAHRVRGPLAGVRGAIELVRNRVEPRSWEHEILTQALEALDRVDADVASLLEASTEPGE